MIEFKGVTKKYGKNLAVQGVDFTIEDGEFVFIVGPSGAGKSTIIKLIMKEIDPDKGAILINGKNVTRLPNRLVPEHRRKVGIVFQDCRLLPKKTAYENEKFAMDIVHASKRKIKRQVPKVLALVGLEDKGNYYPHQLSAGEQQRVAIARALVNSPSVLIADEPTGNLDPETAWGIMEILTRINDKGTTVLMVTHAKEIVNKMNKRVIDLRDGRVVRDEEEGAYKTDGRI